MNVEEKDTAETSKKPRKSKSDRRISTKKNNETKNAVTNEGKIIKEKGLNTKKKKVPKSKLKSNVLSTSDDKYDKENDRKNEEKDTNKKVKGKSAGKSKKRVNATEVKRKKPRKPKKKEKESQELSIESKDRSEPEKKVWVEVFRDGRESISHNHPFKGIKLREPGPLKRLVTRQEWEAKAVDLTRVSPLHLPITHIRYVQTGGPVCRMPTECDELINEMQWGHMKNGSPDIKYNFLVTRNALVYEGRGWKHKSEDSAPPIGKSIDVAFVGDFTNKKVPKDMIKAAEDLIDWGVYHYKIHCCHEVASLLDHKSKEDPAGNIPL